ncbi:hypothetical protein Sjap_002513 [Stephania japonica]|uniref:F-box protein n=1 Tax=Stephania japonica TaxID=461633 RepID=A0AAP0PSL5_9MAGN
MATLQTSANKLYHSPIKAALHLPNRPQMSNVSLPKLPTRTNLILEELKKRSITTDDCYTATSNGRKPKLDLHDDKALDSTEVVAELYAIMEAVADRVEMHTIIGEQRNNWNNLLLTSINAITITASTMAGLAAIAGSGAPLLALKLSSTLLYSAATAIILVMNKIQPSQLAEEQRNAARLFKQLHNEIETTLALQKNPTHADVKDAMEKVFTIDQAYPLPLLNGVMLDKFPKSVSPAVWWPQHDKKHRSLTSSTDKNNGWSVALEKEMKGVLGVLKRKDAVEYMRLSNLVLKVNKVLAISGPLLTTIAAIGSAFIGSSISPPFVVLGVVGGALASVVNTIEHGGQVGMVFEMYRSCAGSFQLLQENIESALEEREVGMRENGELLEMKVALQLGRSLSDLRRLGDDCDHGGHEEFASKLF